MENRKKMEREYTNKLLEVIEEYSVNEDLFRDTVIMACLKYMSEDEVKDMCELNCFLEDDEDDEVVVGDKCDCYDVEVPTVYEDELRGIENE